MRKSRIESSVENSVDINTTWLLIGLDALEEGEEKAQPVCSRRPWHTRVFSINAKMPSIRAIDSSQDGQFADIDTIASYVPTVSCFDDAHVLNLL